MSTYGDPNAVGQRIAEPKPVPLVRTGVGVGSAAVGAHSMYRAARPDLAGMSRRADARIADIDRKIVQEGRYRKPSQGKLFELNRDRQYAVKHKTYVATQAHRHHTPLKRVGRGALGLAGVGAGVALAKPAIDSLRGRQ